MDEKGLQPPEPVSVDAERTLRTPAADFFNLEHEEQGQKKEESILPTAPQPLLPQRFTASLAVIALALLVSVVRESSQWLTFTATTATVAHSITLEGFESVYAMRDALTYRTDRAAFITTLELADFGAQQKAEIAGAGGSVWQSFVRGVNHVLAIALEYLRAIAERWRSFLAGESRTERELRAAKEELRSELRAELLADLSEGRVVEGDLDGVYRNREGLIIVPRSGNVANDSARMERIAELFSDEVVVFSDKTGSSGVIRPVFKNRASQDYLYVVVPVNNN